jgi:hypothetical protein
MKFLHLFYDLLVLRNLSVQPLTTQQIISQNRAVEWMSQSFIETAFLLYKNNSNYYYFHKYILICFKRNIFRFNRLFSHSVLLIGGINLNPLKKSKEKTPLKKNYFKI